MASVLLILRALLLGVSFAGLCAALSARFRLDRFVAPFVAASGIIIALMLAGMLGLLLPAACALYAAGFAGVAWQLWAKRCPPPGMLLALALFTAFLVWRFYFCPLERDDDFSHWALVARHLLLHDRFPRGGDSVIVFQSYPVGAACFIYYIARFTENSEGVYLIAQNLLLALLFLPTFSLIRARRGTYYPIAFALFFLLIHRFHYMISLQVDLVQSFFGIGAAAAIARYRGDFRRALLAALPAMIAVVFIKNSGLFFAFATAAMLLYVAPCGGARRSLRLAVALFAAPLLAFLLWELHIKLRFPAALDTKHAVSLASYAQESAGKGLPMILQIAARQLRAMLDIRDEKSASLAVMVLCGALLLYATRALPAERRRRYRACFALSVAAYLLWYLMVFLMYVFSMPQREALALASIFRYNSTGLAYMLGLAGILLLLLFQQVDPLPRLMRLGGRLCPLFVAGVVALTAWPGGGRLSYMFRRSTRPGPQRLAIQQLRDEYGLGSDSRILAYFPSDVANGQNAASIYCLLKYECETDDIRLITSDPSAPGEYVVGADRANLPPEGTFVGAEDSGGLTVFQGFGHGAHVCLPLTDVPGYVASALDDVDIFLILGDDTAFESLIAPVLAEYRGDAAIRRHPTTA